MAEAVSSDAPARADLGGTKNGCSFFKEIDGGSSAIVATATEPIESATALNACGDVRDPGFTT